MKFVPHANLQLIIMTPCEQRQQHLHVGKEVHVIKTSHEQGFLTIQFCLQMTDGKSNDDEMDTKANPIKDYTCMKDPLRLHHLLLKIRILRGRPMDAL